MYHTAQSFMEAINQSKKSMPALVLAQESEYSGLSEDEIKSEMRRRLEIMRDAANRARQKPLHSLSGLTGGNAYQIQSGSPALFYLDPVMIHALARAMSVSEVNAHMGKIVAAPTAGAAGILPAALLTAQERKNYNDELLIEGLLVAGGVGAIIAQNATISGAEGGCQAECGAAAAMAAAALTFMAGGTPETSFRAAGFALISIMGLICDPVGGLVEFPCALRNAHGVMNAFTAADLALANVTSLVPFDEVVEAMYRVGQSLPMQLRETALGGIAQTPGAQTACSYCFQK